jgi:hypothetical protein
MHAYDKSGQLFDVDLKEVRKQGLVPSVTEIIKEFENSYGLELYKQKQMFLASLTMPRPEGITDEQFYDLVVEDSKVHSEKAKQFGIDVHRMVTGILKDETNNLNMTNYQKKAQQIIDWIKSNKDNCIVDIKTTETKDSKFRQPYYSWLFQLCGYKLEDNICEEREYIDYSFGNNLYGGTLDYAIIHNISKPIKLINLIVSSNEDIPIKVYSWKPEKVEWGCKVFLKMVELYNTMKKLG